MKRSPMRRTEFKRPEREPRKAPVLRPIVGCTATMLKREGVARMSVAIPKLAYVRDERYRDACRALPCQHCGASGPDAGVTWAHSNQGQHGHGRGIKASDQFVAALCWACHAELDQGNVWDRAEKVRVWDEAHAKTVQLAAEMGLWPEDELIEMLAWRACGNGQGNRGRA